MKRALVLCATAIAVAATGCGSGGGAGGPADAAKLAPAGTLGYASADIAPEGDQRHGFDAAFGKLLGPDPESKLAKELTDAVKEEGSKLDYEADVEPWLGRTATIVLTGISGGRAQWALLLASTDDDKARAAIDKDLAGSGAASRSYRGVDYRLIDGGTANGVVGHHLVAGTEQAFRAIVDTDRDGGSLADSQAWRESVGDRGEGRIGLGFLDVKATIQSALSGIEGAGAALGPLVVGLVPLHPLVATLDAQPDRFVLDVSSPGTKPGGDVTSAASSPLIETLPSDAWGALALPGVGKLVGKVVAALRLSPLIARQYERFTRELRRDAGLDLERDVLAAIGDVGAFIRGTSERSVNGGVLVAAADRAAMRRTLASLPRLLARAGDVSVRKVRGGFDVTAGGLPRAIEVREGGPGAVATYGPATAALVPRARLGASPAFRRAGAALGARPMLFVSIPPLLDLIRSTGAADDLKPDEEARLRRLDDPPAGARRDRGDDVIRVVLGLR